MSRANDCVFCCTEVRPRQEAPLCDGCDHWQHRVCESGISRPDYRRLVKGELGAFAWLCCNCKSTLQPDTSLDDMVPVAESTTLENGTAVDSQFDIELPIEDLPQQPQETSVARAIPDDTMEAETTANYEVLPGGSKKGADLLTDSLGVTYVLKRTTSRATTWRCSLRSCRATVSQCGPTHQRGPRPHNHGGDPGVNLRCKTRTMVCIDIKSQNE